MAMPAQFSSTPYALAAACSWGISDFVGGYTARRFQAFFLAALGHLSGTVLMVVIALAERGSFPRGAELGWACAAGLAAGVSLAIFYRALSQGNMGFAAPLTAVLSAGIPTIYAIMHEGFPGYLTIGGFSLALFGIWMISRPEAGSRPKGLLLATVAGIGFALFFIFIRKTGNTDVFWVAACARAASLVVTGSITLAGRKFKPTYPVGYVLGIGAGFVDVTGTVMFVLASQAGRLDTAVVLSSLYPAITVLLAWIFLREKFTLLRTVGALAALAAIPMIAHA